MSNSAMGPRGRKERGLTKNRREAGTSLVEILVVIVIFLIGILAVVQIFPRGFGLLITTRNNTAATALGRDAIERMKSNPDLIPDEIVPVRYDSAGNPVVDTTINPLLLGPQGDTLSPAGILTSGGTQVTTDWLLASGANVARRIVGEGHRLPAAREIGSVATGNTAYENYGSLLILDHGPIGKNSPLVAYANDLTRTVSAPRDSAYVLTNPADPTSTVAVPLATYPGGRTTAVNFSGQEVTSPVALAPFEYFVVNADGADAAIYLPANHLVARTYRVRMSAYLGSPASVKRYDYLSLNVTVPAITDQSVPLVRVPLGPLLSGTNEYTNGSLYGIEPESIRVAPQYVNVSDPNRGAMQNKWTTAASLGLSSSTPYLPVDPFEMKVQDAYLGVLLFSPAAQGGTVDRPGGTSEPIVARVDYDVRDWRVISETFRVVNNNATFQLALQSLKVGASNGPDGLPNGGILSTDRSTAINTNAIDPSPAPRDNVILIDDATGFEVQRYRNSNTDSSTGRTMADVVNSTAVGSDVLVSVDKSRGSITLNDAKLSTPDVIDVILIPPAGDPITVPANNRTFRVLYRARNEWSVQVFKAASQYSILQAAPQPASFGADQCFVGSATKIYFPPSEVGHKVTVDRIVYKVGSNPVQILEGQDFVLRIGGGDASGYAYADITDAVAGAQFPSEPPATGDPDYGTPIQGVKGASLSVRVLWNPDAFSLTTSSDTNLDRADKWARSWRKSTTETVLRAEETR